MPVTVRQRNLQTRQVGRKLLGGKTGTNKKSLGFWKSTKKCNESEVLVTNAPTDSTGILFPSPTTALLCLLAARLAAASWSHITDCDETFNYWEPLHYLIYGSGMQTWEYSPVYAIRSYVPLSLLAVPASLLSLIPEVSSTLVFYLLRYLLAAATASCEALFYKAVCQEFGVHVGRMWLALALASCGSYVSSAALLPSAWCGALTTAALACWWLNRLPAAVCLIAVSALVAWPFAGILGAPIAIDIVLRRRRIADFAKWCAVSLAAVLPPLLLIDSWYYGRFVLAPWNIIVYNLFTEHGPDLYGVEPWTFYFLNGFLNFNITWVLALMCPVWLLLCWVLISQAKPRIQFCQPYWLSLMPLYIWLAVFIPQPHKEERFLFPVYSMVCLCSAISIDCIQKMTFTLKTQIGVLFDKYVSKKKTLSHPLKRSHYLSHTNFIMVIFVLVSFLGGLSRIVALYRNYHAPMTILRALPTEPHVAGDGEVHVCFGKDWYRSPSSFFLPHERYRMRFVKSEFSGQLPVQYSSEENATRLIRDYFNDGNREDARTYLNATDCHYLVDSDVEPPTLLQPAYVEDTSQWDIVSSVPFLNVAESHRVFRAFYIPFLDYTTFGNMYLLRNKVLVTTP